MPEEANLPPQNVDGIPGLPSIQAHIANSMRELGVPQESDAPANPEAPTAEPEANPQVEAASTPPAFDEKDPDTWYEPGRYRTVHEKAEAKDASDREAQRITGENSELKERLARLEGKFDGLSAAANPPQQQVTAADLAAKMERDTGIPADALLGLVKQIAQEESLGVVESTLKPLNSQMQGQQAMVAKHGQEYTGVQQAVGNFLAERPDLQTTFNSLVTDHPTEAFEYVFAQYQLQNASKAFQGKKVEAQQQQVAQDTAKAHAGVAKPSQRPGGQGPMTATEGAANNGVDLQKVWEEGDRRGMYDQYAQQRLAQTPSVTVDGHPGLKQFLQDYGGE